MKVVIVRNPRTTGGSISRLDTWHRLGRAIGADIDEVEVGFDPLAAVRSPGRVIGVARGRLVPEALSWDERRLRQRLDELAPDVVILQTVRTYGGLVAGGPWLTVLDLVDRLSVSYRQRAGATGPLVAAFLRVLARSHRRTEGRLGRLGVRPVVASRSGAEALGVPWLPILAPAKAEMVTPPVDPEFDAVFFGTLNYPPNYEALRWLAEADGIDRLRVLVTGRNPHRSVEPLCARMGWTFEPDFADVASLGRRAAVAVAPLISAAGIQIKVLEAAANGIPQVVTPMAMQGFDPAFPVVRVSQRHDFAHAVAALSDDPNRRRELAIEAARHVDAHYSEAAWADEVRRLLSARSSAVGLRA